MMDENDCEEIAWINTVAVPSGLSEDETKDSLWEDRYLRQIYQPNKIEIDP